jgi:hypothetical protein
MPTGACSATVRCTRSTRRRCLHAVSAIAIVVGAVYVLRIVQRAGGSGVLASATALVFVLNDNTARTLNYGFHLEVL